MRDSEYMRSGKTVGGGGGKGQVIPWSRCDRNRSRLRAPRRIYSLSDRQSNLSTYQAFSFIEHIYRYFLAEARRQKRNPR